MLNYIIFGIMNIKEKIRVIEETLEVDLNSLNEETSLSSLKNGIA